MSGCRRIFCADSASFSNANGGGDSVNPRNLQKFAKLLNALNKHKQINTNVMYCTDTASTQLVQQFNFVSTKHSYCRVNVLNDHTVLYSVPNFIIHIKIFTS